MGKTSVENFDAGKFRQIREAAGLSVTDLAKQSGISRGAISQWENGISTPSVARLTAVLAVLDSHASEVLDVVPTDFDLRTLRILSGLTRSDVATFLKLSESGWGDIERGTTPLSVARIEPLSTLLGTDQTTIVRAAQRTIDNNR